MDLRVCIKHCPLFAGVSDEDLSSLLQVAHSRDYERGELLFSEGDPAAGFYLVCSGKVKIYKLSSEGKERILHIVQPGQSFAEAAIFGSGNYPAFAEPIEKARLIFFPRTEFLALLASQSQIAINMIAGLSRFLRQFAAQIEELTFRDVPARLARFLVDLGGAGATQVTLPFSKTQLASQLGTVSETLSRTFRKFSDEAILDVQGKVICILDPDRLEELSGRFEEP